MSPWQTPDRESSIHAMTCDVEDYFQVSAFSDIVDRSDWDRFECRIPRNVDQILQTFEKADIKATFFTLGWVAKKFPEVVRRIAAAGHEIASHGMVHTRVWQQTPKEFLADVVTSRKLLEDVSGRNVVGYRAASWSVDGRTPWAHDVLAEAGYGYSSSIYPISHDHFGMPNALTHPHYVEGSGLLEIPASVARLFGRNVPAAGGGYFRLYPLNASLWLINRIQTQTGQPYVFYFHPWEMDPEQPRFTDAPLRARLRHYLNLDKFRQRLNILVRRFEWGRMDEIYLGEAEV